LTIDCGSLQRQVAVSEERKAVGASARVSQVIGQLGVYATYLAAALFLLVIFGDLRVLLDRAPLTNWLGPLVVIGPVVALQLSTLASYINFYGVWRVARRKDEYEAKQDLKSHAADLPQAAQALLAGRAGCLPTASVALVFCSLVLLGITLLPPATPMVGALGVWNHGIDGVALITNPGTQGGPSVTPATVVTPVPTLAPTATPTPIPTATPTQVPVIIKFAVSPTTASYDCQQGLSIPPVTLKLDTTGSTVPVEWTAPGVSWATLSSTSGIVPANSNQSAITVTPNTNVCSLSYSNGSVWAVTIAPKGAATQTFRYSIFGIVPG
jgi:hypothetical protein